MKKFVAIFFGLIPLTYLYHLVTGTVMTSNTKGGMIFFGVVGLVFVALALLENYNKNKEI